MPTKSETRKIKVKASLLAAPGAIQAPMPSELSPQLATLTRTPPAGKLWIHEAKYDGYRMLGRISNGTARLLSRNNRDWTHAFPGIARALERLRVKDAWIDGEVVVMMEDGRTSFQALQTAIAGEPSGDLQYFAFDLLYVDGLDLRRVLLGERKAILQKLLKKAPANIAYSDHLQVHGRAFLERVCKLGLEGMISKRTDRPFEAGRSASWVKVKCLQRQEMVIGGFTDPVGSRIGFGALLLGVYEPGGKFRYSGKVGTGLNDRTLATLHKRLLTLQLPTPAFYNPPRGAEARRSHWVQPILVAEVAFGEWTNEGTLRHPSFLGLREDKVATEVVRERAAAM